jgi:hypothetical protein
VDEFTLGKSGRQRGAENVASVIAYLDELDRAGERVPLNPDGSPNYSEIARLCGFGRQVFYTNEKARQLVEQRIPRNLDAGPPGPLAKQALQKVNSQDRQIRRLEEKVAALSAELESLRMTNRLLTERLRQYELIEEVLDVGRYRP